MTRDLHVLVPSITRKSLVLGAASGGGGHGGLGGGSSMRSVAAPMPSSVARVAPSPMTRLRQSTQPRPPTAPQQAMSRRRRPLPPPPIGGRASFVVPGQQQGLAWPSLRGVAEEGSPEAVVVRQKNGLRHQTVRQRDVSDVREAGLHALWTPCQEHRALHVDGADVGEQRHAARRLALDRARTGARRERHRHVIRSQRVPLRQRRHCSRRLRVRCLRLRRTSPGRLPGRRREAGVSRARPRTTPRDRRRRGPAPPPRRP